MTSSCFAFLPGQVIAGPEHVKAWAQLSNIESSAPEIFANTHPSVLRGIKKQYEILAKWIDDPIHPLAQYVLPQTSCD